MHFYSLTIDGISRCQFKLIRLREGDREREYKPLYAWQGIVPELSYEHGYSMVH